VLLVLSVTLSVLGVDKFMSAQGLNLGMLLVFSLVVGFTRSLFISLLMSKPMAKWSTGAQVIDGSEGATQFALVEHREDARRARRQHRHAGSRHLRRRAQRLRHRRVRELVAGRPSSTGLLRSR
jgi:hypothetical protein